MKPRTVAWVALLACVSAAYGCGYSEEEMQAKQARIDGLTASLEEANQRHRELQLRFQNVSNQNTSMTARLQQMDISVEQLQEQRGDLQRAIEQLRDRERRAQARLDQFKAMLGRFQQMIASGKLRVRIVRGRMVVELSENILFDSGKAELKAEGTVALGEVAKVLQTIEGRDFQIAGHTDNVPIKSRRFPSNWDLSTARSVNVAQALAQQGVPETRLSAAGYADTQPVADNETPEGRQQNRRIEIVLMPNLDELPDLSSLETAAAEGGRQAAAPTTSLTPPEAAPAAPAPAAPTPAAAPTTP